MANQTDNPGLGANVYSLLGGVRRWIRAYIWFEGIAVALLWIGATFWLALGCDYLFVMLGASELPWQARAVLLVGIVGVLGFILYWWIFRRAFIGLANHSMAVVLERRYANFRDSLLTSVEMSEKPEHANQFNQEMLQHTRDDAHKTADSVRIGHVFNLFPLALSSVLAVLIAVSIGLFAFFAQEMFLLGASRLYLLNDAPWPRKAQIEIVGIEVEAPSGTRAGGDATRRVAIPFRDGVVKVAEGSDLTLRVRAETDLSIIEKIPDTCDIYYTTDGGSNRVKMQADGRIDQLSYQNYSFDGKPFRGVISTIEFDVRGYDHWVRNYRVEVVASPALTGITLDSQYPKYMVEDEISGHRIEAWTSGKRLPIGADVTVRGEASKDLRYVHVHNQLTDETTTIDVAGEDLRNFSYSAGVLTEDVTLIVTLHDTDDVISETPYRIYLGAIEDLAPSVEMRLAGIGTAVTPSVIIPLQGSVRDDYGVESAWIEVDTPDAGKRLFPFKLGRAGAAEPSIDFQKLAEAETMPIALQPKQKLAIQVKARDYYDLGDAHTGEGDIYELDVVTPEELVRMLERREVALRQRFEQMIDEMLQARDLLLSVRNANAKVNLPDRPDPDQPNEPVDDEKIKADIRVRKLLNVQQAGLQSDKSQQEVAGVSLSFADIRGELVNNRVDVEDQKERLLRDVIEPLNHISEEMFPELKTKLEELEKALADPKAEPAAIAAAIDSAEAVIKEMETVLAKMIEIEDFNQLLEIVRDILKEQEELIDATKKQQAKETLEGLKLLE